MRIKSLLSKATLYPVMLALLSFVVMAAGPKISDLDKNSWVHVAVNTAMLGAILFIIYIYSVPNKDGNDNSKKIAIAIAALGVCGAISFQFLNNMWFWQYPIINIIFHGKVLVNIGVTGTALFGILMIAQMMSEQLKSQMQQTAGKFVAISLIVILTFSVSLGAFYDKDHNLLKWDQVKDYPYVWEHPEIKDITMFLLGNAKCTEEGTGKKYCYYENGAAVSQNGESAKFGILRPPYIIVFFLSMLLCIWAFRTFNFVTEIKWLQYIFAFIISSQVANRGWTIYTFAGFAQYLGLFIIQKSLTKSDNSMRVGISRTISFGIVTMLMTKIFPEYAVFPFSWFTGWGLLGLAILIGVIIAVVMLFNMKKKDGKKGMFTRATRNYSIALLNHIKNGLKRSRFGIGLSDIWEKVDSIGQTRTGDDEFYQTFRELNVEFQALMNFMLRLEVFGGKLATVRRHKLMSDDAYTMMVSPTHTFQSLDEEIKLYKLGPGYKVDNDGNVAISAKAVAGIDCYGQVRGVGGPASTATGKEDEGISARAYVGGLATPFIYYQVFKGLSGALEMESSGEPSNDFSSDFKDGTVEKVSEKYLMSPVESIMKTSAPNFNAVWANEDSRIRRYGALNIVKSQRMMILDQYRMSGRCRDYSYVFAHPKAKVTHYKVHFDDVTGEGTLLNSVNTLKGNPELGRIKPPPSPDEITEGLHMANPEGFIVEDLKELDTHNLFRLFKKDHDNCIGALKQKTFTVRRIAPENFLWGDFSKVMEWQENSWTAYVEGIRFGMYNPYSRTASQYTTALANHDFRYKSLKPKNSSWNPDKDGPSDDPAFDRESLKDISMIHLSFFDRPNYWDDKSDTRAAPATPFPTLSTLGLTRYIKSRIRNEVKNQDNVKELMTHWVYESGKRSEYMEDMFTRTPKGEGEQNG